MDEDKLYKCCEFEIYENDDGKICIKCDLWDTFISFDECMAEKMCKYIMKIAQQIRVRQAKEEQ